MVLPPLAPGLEAVVSLTARVYVCTALPEDEALHRVPDGFGGATDPGTLLALARGGTVGVLDAALVREGAGGQPVLPVRHDLDDHPRVRHARAVRRDVVVRGDERGLVTLATGLAGAASSTFRPCGSGRARGGLSATRSPARPIRVSRLAGDVLFCRMARGCVEGGHPTATGSRAPTCSAHTSGPMSSASWASASCCRTSTGCSKSILWTCRVTSARCDLHGSGDTSPAA